MRAQNAVQVIGIGTVKRRQQGLYLTDLDDGGTVLAANRLERELTPGVAVLLTLVEFSTTKYRPRNCPGMWVVVDADQAA